MGKHPQPPRVTNGRGDHGLDRRVSRELSDVDNIPLQEVGSCRTRSPMQAGAPSCQRGTERHQRAGDRQTQHQLVLRKNHPPLLWGQSIAQPNATARAALALSKPGTLSTTRLTGQNGTGFHRQTTLWSVREACHLDKNTIDSFGMVQVLITWIASQKLRS